MMIHKTAAFVLLLVTAPLATARDMNVVFILVDDWGITDGNVLGSDFFETPVIDQFSRQSLMFTQAYSASPVCSPTRAAILTGKSPARLDMTIWHENAVSGGPKDKPLLEAKSQPNLPREEVTLADMFKQKNYYTAHIGKWHLGTAAYYPETQGYDLNVGATYWGAPASFFYPYRGHWSATDPELRYVPVGPGREGDYLTDRLTDHAVETIEAHRDEPFFISLWYHTVHTPIQGKPELVKHFQNKSPGVRHNHPEYAAMVASLDENVGRVLQTLDELQLADNTVVILTSDNGGVDFPSRKAGDRVPTVNTPWRSGKGTLYEGGIRVPLMIRWPGRTKPGTTCDEMVTSEDIFPTLAEGLDLGVETLTELDGTSLVALMVNPAIELDRDTLFWHYPHYYPRMTPGSAVRNGDWKLIHYYEDDTVEVFNLAADPGETTDISAQHPDRVQQLRTRLNAWRRDTDANAPVANPEWEASR
jgi:arylsulfatase A